MFIGDFWEGKVFLGVVVDECIVFKVNSFIDDVVSKGVCLVFGGKSDSVLM